ncbi:hypothetical protein PBI_DEWDROP_141 [Microbacterium phage Dewdrop]|nr:hypothetical protein PBI_LEAF_141 [Microbacterium phage Leaf]QGZ17509.1 hypothetical protein PBI_DEWDROP_141 [Microbacterium phage Dewdrop]
MAAPTNEAGLVKQIVVAVKKQYPDSWIMKVHGGPMQVAGIPDLLIVVHGLLIGAEVKHQKPRESEEHARGRATPIQRAQIEKLRKAGATADVVLSAQETLALIEQAIITNQEKRNG